MLINAAPGALLWPAAMIVWGPGYTSSGHSHHCVHLVMAVRGKLRVRGQRGCWLNCGGVLIQPDAVHEVQAPETMVLIAFVDPESELGVALAERLTHEITRIDARVLASWRASLGSASKLDASKVEHWVRMEFLHGRKAPQIHPRVKRVLRFLRNELGASQSVTLGKLASIAGLSRSRLVHVFTECVGVPVRPYILWLRLQRASGKLMGGATVTEAAHYAGFSDAAHLTRTFRRMLGTTPRELARRREASRRAFVQSN